MTNFDSMFLLAGAVGFGLLLVAGAIIQWRRRGKYDFYPEPTGDDLPATIPWEPTHWEQRP